MTTIKKTISIYYKLLDKVSNKSVSHEEYARTMIQQEELHSQEVQKMLKSNSTHWSDMNIQFEKNLIITHKSRPGWDNCDKAKHLLDDAGLSYPYLICEKWSFSKIMKDTGSHTLAQIIIDGDFIGGFEELNEFIIQLDKS